MADEVGMKLSRLRNKIPTDFNHLKLMKAITEGRLCTAQAVIKQIGGDGVALSYVPHGGSHHCCPRRFSQSRFLSQVLGAYYLSIS